MPKILETVEVDYDGNIGRINKKDFDPSIHTLWKQDVVEAEVEEPSTEVVVPDETPEAEEALDDSLTLAEQVNDLSTWAEFEKFVADNNLDFDTSRGVNTLKRTKVLLLELLSSV